MPGADLPEVGGRHHLVLGSHLRYRTLACDYDGTVAAEGALHPAAGWALERLRAAGHKLLLVTGRRLDDLSRACPELALFEAIVAENGAVLHLPALGATRVLAEPPPPPSPRRSPRAVSSPSSRVG